ncbi:MAG TPA: hypothetical protein VIL72_12230 [Beijerinckiaceae bacterium]|jgi:hypothetical protein
MASVPHAGAADVRERGVYYGHNYHVSDEGRCLGEDVCGSGVFYVFESVDAFKSAVTEYNVLGRIRARDASLGRA